MPDAGIVTVVRALMRQNETLQSMEPPDGRADCAAAAAVDAGAAATGAGARAVVRVATGRCCVAGGCGCARWLGACVCAA
eukprot:5472271-Prymnesium_polylepis.1